MKLEDLPDIDLEMAAAFLGEFGDKHCIATIDPATGRVASDYGAFDRHAASLTKVNREGRGVFFVVNDCSGDTRRAEHIKRVRAVFVDLDGSPLDSVHHGPLEPQLIVESSPGRYHAYWLVSDVPLELFKPIQQRLAAYYDGDPAVCDLPRLMRLPGFLHHKKEPFQSRVLVHNNLPRYILAQLEQAYGSFTPASSSQVPKTKVIPMDSYRDRDAADGTLPDFTLIQAECAFMQHAVTSAETLSEPEWWSMVSVAAHCQDGDKLVHSLSQPHPNYSHHETAIKVERAVLENKPQTCEYIQNHINSQFCGKCSHREKIKSPIRLGKPRLPAGSRKIDPKIEKLNRTHAVVTMNGSTVVLNEERDEKGRPTISFSSFADLRNRYSNKKVSIPAGDGFEQIPLGSYWLDHKDRRQYDRLAFAPGGTVPDNVYNLYRGLAVEPVKGDWSKMARHIFQIICGGDRKVFRYLLAYLARMVQDPGGDRPGVALVLLGEQGTGKGEFVRSLGALFGIHFLHIASQQQLTGRFNMHMMNCLLLYVDEGFWAGDKTAEGVLKALITEPTIAVEPKGRDLFSVDNHLNIIFSSNNDWVVPAGLEERRFLVLKVSSERRQDHEYFKGLRAQMGQGGLEAMLYSLLTLDISKVNLRQVPRTQALLDQIVHSLDSVGAFWFETLKEGDFPRGRRFKEEYTWNGSLFGNWFGTNLLYIAYVCYCEDRGLQRKDSREIFAKRLKKLCAGMQPHRRPSQEDKARTSGYFFPELDLCRQAFERAVNIRVPWEE